MHLNRFYLISFKCIYPYRNCKFCNFSIARGGSLSHSRLGNRTRKPYLTPRACFEGALKTLSVNMCHHNITGANLFGVGKNLNFGNQIKLPLQSRNPKLIHSFLGPSLMFWSQEREERS